MNQRERSTPNRIEAAKMWESFADYNLSKDILLKEVNDLTEEEAKELLNTIHSLLMPEELSEPSVSSTYPGEASGSISPATL